MKKLIGYTCFVSAIIASSFAQQVVFNQDFSAGGVVGDYDDGTANEFDQIGSSGGSMTWSLNSGALQGVRSGNAGALTVADVNVAPIMIVRFSFSLISTTADATGAMSVRLGSGFSTTTNSAPTNASTHSRFAINFDDAVTDGFQLRKNEGGNENSGSFTGSQNLFWIVNSSSVAYDYTNPAGTTSSVAADSWSVWVGTSSVFSNVGALTASVAIEDFKLTWESGSGTVQFDNFNFTAVPEPHEYAIALAGLMVVLVIARRRSAGMRS